MSVYIQTFYIINRCFRSMFLILKFSVCTIYRCAGTFPYVRYDCRDNEHTVMLFIKACLIFKDKKMEYWYTHDVILS